MNYGFLGTGNMADAIVCGVLNKGFINKKNVYVYSRNQDKREYFAKKHGVFAMNSAEEVIAVSDILILAVKPDVVTRLLSEYALIIQMKKPLIISLAVSLRMEDLENALGDMHPVARVMPNINAKIGESMTAFCSNNLVTPEMKTIAYEMFNTIGTVIEIEEDQFSIFAALCGSSIAYAFLFIDALASAGVRAGLDKKTALYWASHMVIGSGKMVAESKEHPQVLIDQVCSPGGTTIEGLLALKELGFESAVVKAVEAVLKKDSHISL